MHSSVSNALKTCLAVVSLFVSNVPSISAPVPTVEIAVSRELLDNTFINRTLDALSDSLARNQVTLQVRAANVLEIEELVRNDQIDLFIAPSTLYRRLLLSGCSDIAATHETRTHNPNRAEGVLFLNRLDTDSADVLDPRTALRLGTNNETETLAIRGELLQHGMNSARTRTFLESVPLQPLSNATLRTALDDLSQGRRNLLILPVCQLERYCETTDCSTGNLSVLWPKQDTDMACLHSSELYPGTTLTATPRLSPFALKEVLRTIYSLTPAPNGQSWQVVTNFQTTDLMLQALDDGAWAQIENFTLRRFFDRWRWWIAAGVCIASLIIVHAIILQILVRRKTRQLRKALVEQKKARRETEVISQRLEQQRRLQTIGQMASLFAHELGQPLNAIGCYAHGISKATQNSENRTAVQKGIHGIETQVGRASAIVERVRDYVRSQTVRTHRIELDVLVKSAIKNFKITSLGSTPVSLEDTTSRSLCVLGDPLELELIVINLLRNASQAQQRTLHPSIRITLLDSPSPGFIVTDNGSGLDEEKLSRIVHAGESTRPEGLGLGLTIVRNLVALHNGTIRFSLTRKGGLRVQVLLPAAPEPSSATASEENQEVQHE